MAGSMDDGLISDESSFYGDDDTKHTLENKTKRKLKLPDQFPANPRKRKAGDVASPDRESKTPRENALDFLKSRPQIGEMQKSAAKERQPTKKEPARTVVGDEAAEFLDDSRFQGDRSAWQHDESVDAFLMRAPIWNPETAILGPWLWVGNPRPIRSQHKHEAKTDIGAFVDGGVQLLETFSQQRAKFESANPNAASATITRRLGPYKEQLEDDLLALAVKTGTTCGKWMFFPDTNDFPRYWRLVAEATAAGKLGVTSKAATLDAHNQAGLICVYTYDFTDGADVRRVLNELIDLGLCRADGKPIYYKCDAYTYLVIQSENPYKLRASLYSSKEILNEEAKPKQEGPIARLKKRHRTVDNFFAS